MKYLFDCLDVRVFKNRHRRRSQKVDSPVERLPQRETAVVRDVQTG